MREVVDLMVLDDFGLTDARKMRNMNTRTEEILIILFRWRYWIRISSREWSLTTTGSYDYSDEVTCELHWVDLTLRLT